MPQAARQKTPPKSSKGSDSMPPLPAGWCWVTLGDVTESMKNGIYRPASSYSEDGIACLRMYNIDQGKIVWRDIKRMTLTEDEIEEYELLPGDLLVNRVNSRELVGKTVAIPPNFDRCVFESKNIRVRLQRDVVVPEYVSYRLLAEGSRYFMENAQQVVGMASINQSQVASFPLPLPPLNAQRRIVAEIEKQFTRLEAGVAALQQIQANLKRYRASVLKAACEGRLVPTEAHLARTEDRTYETAMQMLARTPTPPRPNRWSARSKDKIPGHRALAVGNPGSELPEGWAWSALVEIAKMESGHTPSRNHPEWWEGDVPWVGISDARERHGRIIYVTSQHTNAAGIANSSARLLPAGTVCVSRTASVGYVVVLGREMATSQDFVNWIPTPAVNSDWLRIIFTADREALRRFGKGSVHNTIYFPEWLSVNVAVPPLSEQLRIVAETERRLSVADEMEAAIVCNLQRAISMRQGVLQRAFCGHLASHDASEEAADAMLKRAKANPIRTRPLLPKSNKQRSKPMPIVPIENLEELLSRLDALGGSCAPNRLLMDLNLGSDVERFFDLLRAGRDNGTLHVPTGKSGNIRRLSHAS